MNFPFFKSKTKTPTIKKKRSALIDWSLLSMSGNLLKSADTENNLNINNLRSEARLLCRTNPYAAKYLNMVSANVIGPNGISLQARVSNARGGPNQIINKRIEDSWYEFGKKCNFSVDGKLDIVGFQRLAAITLAADGEVLIRKIHNKSKYGFQVQLLDIDLLLDQSRITYWQGNRVVDGVEIDIYGKPIAYHMYTQHPSEYNAKPEIVRLPADEIIHVYEMKRPGQTRGLTKLHPVIKDLGILQEYITAEVSAAKAGAKSLVVMEAQNAEAELALNTAYENTGEDSTTVGNDGRAILLSDTSQGFSVPAGYTLKPININHPSTAFPDFIKAVLRSVATGLGVNYNILASDLESTNYSSIRSGTLEEREKWKEQQVLFATNVLQPIYEAWLEAAIALGKLSLSGPIEAYTYVNWAPKGFMWIDPAKEAQAQILAINNGLKSRTSLLAESGIDIRELFEELATENSLAQEYGLSFLGLAKTAPTESGANPNPADPAAAPVEAPPEQAPASDTPPPAVENPPAKKAAKSKK